MIFDITPEENERLWEKYTIGWGKMERILEMYP